jgi:hypothetical protein
MLAAEDEKEGCTICLMIELVARELIEPDYCSNTLDI